MELLSLSEEKLTILLLVIEKLRRDQLLLHEQLSERKVNLISKVFFEGEN